METTRFILVIALCLVSMMLWQEWEKDYGAKPTPVVETTVVNDNEVSLPVGSLPEEKIEVAAEPQQEEVVTPVITQQAALQQKTILVETDVLSLEISSKGGAVEKASLKKYPVSANQPEEPFVLLDNSEELVYVIQGGLLAIMALQHTRQFLKPQPTATS